MEEKVLKIICQVLEDNDKAVSQNKINKDTLLVNDLGFDSFNLAQLTVEIESEFGIDIFEKRIISMVGEIFDQLR